MKIHRFHSEPMQESWCDAYGHLNEAYYLVPFSNATWIMQDHFGIGVPYFEETGCAILTVETHLRYLSEVRAPAMIEVETLMLRSDAKKIWFAHQMVVDDNICATAEFLCLHYNMDEGRTEPMSEEIQDGLRAAEVATLPDWVGRQISLIRK